jgi:DNA-directed RNA polymerase specialized sigma24 family protein
MQQGSDEFDAFYKAARGRLLVQTYALTGDLPAARSAVRDAFVAAWHHWRKVSRLDDPEGWVRPHAWQHAQRRHTARIWHRDKGLDADSRATLDALSKLSLTQRKVLLLTQLSSASMQEMSREVGLTGEAAERELQTATSRFATQRNVPSTSVRGHLTALTDRVTDSRFPRPSIIRRAGAARRRAHTGTGVAVAVVALFLGGAVVHQSGGVAPDLNGASAQGATVTDGPEPSETLRLEDMLAPEQASQLSRTRTFREGRTFDNTEGDGINSICQEDRFADPDGLGALVRTFDATGSPAMSATQTVELSTSDRAAKRAYERTVGWYAGCRADRVQLLTSLRLKGTGDDGRLLVLRSWKDPVTTYTIGVARTGSIITSTVRKVRSSETPSLEPMLSLMGTAVWSICDHPAAGTCSTRPASTPVPPPPGADGHGLVQVVDLPPAPRVNRPWVATEPQTAKLNTAATRCDKADFFDKSIPYSTTRSFLVPGAGLPSAFGLTETLGSFRNAKAADAFVSTVRGRMDGCEDKDMATTVTTRLERSTKSEDLNIWSVTTEISDDKKVTYLMAIGRRDDVAVQLGFVPVPGHTLSNADFTALAERGLDRISNLPDEK